MSATVIAQVVTAAGTLLTALIFAAGYFMLIKLYSRMNYNLEHQRTANGRPQVIVTDNYSDLPNVTIVLRNMADGAAQSLSFEFSAPVTCSDGNVISEIPYFRDGMAFLSPGGEVTCYWDEMESLIPHLRERGLTEGIDVTVRYYDLAGEYYETTWKLNPFIYAGNRWVYHRGMPDLVEAVEKLTGSMAGSPDRYRTDPIEEPPQVEPEQEPYREGYEKYSHVEGVDGDGRPQDGKDSGIP